MSLVYFCLVCAGLTQILVHGKVFEKIRPTQGWLGQLLSCSMCTGFWTGFFLWSLNGYTELFTFDYSPVTGLFLGCLGSFVSYVLAMTFDDNGIKLSFNKE